MNITVRNIPDDVIDKIKTLSIVDKRSLNNEILVILEKGLENSEDYTFNTEKSLNVNSQIKIWNKLCGKWEDKRSTKKIIADIIENRSLGREIKL